VGDASALECGRVSAAVEPGTALTGHAGPGAQGQNGGSSPLTHSKALRAQAGINPSRYVDGMLENVWNFHVGGYQACEKWLKDRRTLFEENILPCELVAAPFIDAPPVASL